MNFQYVRRHSNADLEHYGKRGKWHVWNKSKWVEMPDGMRPSELLRMQPRELLRRLGGNYDEVWECIQDTRRC